MEQTEPLASVDTLRRRFGRRRVVGGLAALGVAVPAIGADPASPPGTAAQPQPQPQDADQRDGPDPGSVKEGRKDAP